MTSSAEQTSARLHERLADGSMAGTWTLDPARSSASLRSKSVWGLVAVKGVFRDLEGAGTISPSGEVTGHLSLSTSSLETKIAKRDAHLRSDDFFSSEKYPAITFAVDAIEPAGAGFTMSGTLTVRDQSRPISFPVTAAVVTDGEISLDATVKVDRTDFGLTFNQMNMMSVHNTVTVHAVVVGSSPR
jgi:polyisoprenoid-binding protein YceI